MDNPIMRFFEFGHLPPLLRSISTEISKLAFSMDAQLPDCAEKSAGMRKLLEAKDCFVRAKLEEKPALQAVANSTEKSEKTDQEAMDGTPATVVITLYDLDLLGKFKAKPIAPRVSKHDPVIWIQFQVGPIKEVGVNGCAIEDVIDVLIRRLEGFQKGPFACAENQQALKHLTYAKEDLLIRTAKREGQGVEGTNAPHKS